jgi:glycerol-3-phosphate acyltransferase PlsX
MLEDKKLRIAVDSMGGDYAPGEIVRGAVLAAQNNNVEIALVGTRDTLEGELAKCDFADNLPVHIVEANEVIKESELPALAVRRKPNCSVAVAAKLVKSGEVDAMVSAGSTGATLVSAVQFIGMVEGMERPTIGGTLGKFAPNTIVLDFGANVDCKPYQFLSFAIAGSIWAKKLLHIPNPTIALLSTGAEENKGNELVRESYALLKDSGLNFIGNIEGNEILGGKANIIICDGFVGNIILKFYESIGGHALDWADKKLKKYPLLPSLVKSSFNKLFPITRMSFESEEEGSGILWGIDGVVRIAHGACRAEDLAHAIASASNAARVDIVGCLRSELARFKKEGKL